MHTPPGAGRLRFLSVNLRAYIHLLSNFESAVDAHPIKREFTMRRVFASTTALLILLGSAHASPLSDLAEQMEPGQWAQLQTVGWNSSLLEWGGRHGLQYSDNLTWDPLGKEAHYVGSGHQVEYRHLVYSESTNTWARRSLPGSWYGPHSYDHLAIDPINRRFFVRTFQGSDFRIYNLNSQTWSTSARIPGSYLQVAGGAEWFPELSRLVFADSVAGLQLYNPSNNTWSKPAGNNVTGLGDYHNFAEYSPTHKVVIYGGGNGGPTSSAVYAIDSDGSIQRKENAPFWLGITATVITTDPVSGNFVVVRYGNGEYYEYDPTADRWTQIGTVPGTLYQGSPNGGEWGLIATPISTYGVMMFARFRWDGGSSVWLYKHEEGTIPSQPAPPTDLTAD